MLHDKDNRRITRSTFAGSNSQIPEKGKNLSSDVFLNSESSTASTSLITKHIESLETDYPQSSFIDSNSNADTSSSSSPSPIRTKNIPSEFEQICQEMSATCISKRTILELKKRVQNLPDPNAFIKYLKQSSAIYPEKYDYAVAVFVYCGIGIEKQSTSLPTSSSQIPPIAANSSRSIDAINSSTVISSHRSPSSSSSPAITHIGTSSSNKMHKNQYISINHSSSKIGL